MWVGVHIRSAVPGSYVVPTAERETDVAHAHHTQCAHSGGSRELHRTVPHTWKDQLIAYRIKIFGSLRWSSWWNSNCFCTQNSARCNFFIRRHSVIWFERSVAKTLTASLVSFRLILIGGSLESLQLLLWLFASKLCLNFFHSQASGAKKVRVRVLVPRRCQDNLNAIHLFWGKN